MTSQHASLEQARESLKSTDLLVVGAGLFGLTIAERAASAGFRVLIVDRRPHLGGNAYSFVDEVTGIEVHKYGPHFFHTNNAEVFGYLSRFTEWTPFELRVWSTTGGRVFPLPINLATICEFTGQRMSPAQARAWVAAEANTTSTPSNLEEKAISLIGRPLYEAFIRGYTKKQWQVDPKLLPPEIIARLPVRYTFDNRYFNDEYQCMPKHGYGRIFENMLAVGNQQAITGVDWFDLKPFVPDIPVVYTGPIDKYFQYEKGALGWRTVDFVWERHPGDFQGCPIMNFPDDTVPWTRISDFRHMHPDRKYGDETIIAKEFSRFAGEGDEPYYPIDTAADKRLYLEYSRMAQSQPNVVFGGRLGTYKYLDMHQAIGAALKTFEAEVAPKLKMAVDA